MNRPGQTIMVVSLCGLNVAHIPGRSLPRPPHLPEATKQLGLKTTSNKIQASIQFTFFLLLLLLLGAFPFTTFYNFPV